jgi:rare lipoprotein A
MYFKTIKTCAIFSVLFLISACGESNPPFTAQKIGKPYTINGKTYRPSPDDTYDKIGDASWYGPGFHNKRTANGEIFDQEDLTAAHPTLPMPSLVKVTNLANNKSVVVRVNDRGPFHKNRIIDLSKKSAQAIDVLSVKPVRVQFLARETQEYIASIKGKAPNIDMFAYNENYNNRILEGEETSVASYENNEIVDYAPVQSVSSNDLDNSQKKSGKGGNILISEARADDGEQVALYNKAVAAPIRKKPAVQKPVSEVYLASKSVQKEVPASDTKSGGYMIMAGSYSSQENAQKLAKSLGINKEMTAVDNVEVFGKKWWRVQVGPFASKDKAEETLKMVREKGSPDARISRQK